VRNSKVRSQAIAIVLVFGLFAFAKSAAAQTQTFNIQYFEAPTGVGDFYNGDAPGGVSYNYVLPTLGPDGLPVFNPSFTGSGVLAPGSGYLNSSNEILYWTPGKNGIIADGSGTITLSSTPVTMYPPGSAGAGTGGNNNGTGNDTTYEETAIITGEFTVPAGGSDTVTFDVGADDMAFVYVFPVGNPGYANSLVLSLGGIHADTVVPANAVTYGPGTWEIEIFFADREVTGAYLSFTDNADLSITPVSPATFAVNTSTPSAIVQPGGLAQYDLTVTPVGGTFSNAVALSATGLPSGATVSFLPASVTPGSAGAPSVMSIQTSTGLARLTKPKSQWKTSGPLLALLAGFPLLGLAGSLRRLRRSHRRWMLLVLAALAIVPAVAISACNGGYYGPLSQTYTITVTGTSGSLQASTTVSLTVQ
jgi:hypothetical protein